MRWQLVETTAGQLEPGDLVLLEDGHRTVHSIVAPAGAERVWIEWADGGMVDSVWLAAEPCEAVRRR